MGSLNQVALRAEFDGLKGQFERLCADGKMTPESQTLFQTLLMLFEVLMAVFMEKSTPKNSRNASVPPSQTPKDDETASQPGTAVRKLILQPEKVGGEENLVTTPVPSTRDPCTGCHQRLKQHDVVLLLRILGLGPKFDLYAEK